MIFLSEQRFDIVVIGGGVVGTAIAKELSKYRANVILIEKESDVGLGASNSNSGVVHSGFTAPVGSLKAEVCMYGNNHFEEECKELDVPFDRVGKLVVALHQKQIAELYNMQYVGSKNGAELHIVGKDFIKEKEPFIDGVAAMYSPNSAITSPYELTIAYAENAYINGVDIRLNTEVLEIKKNNTGFLLKTNNGLFKTSYVINSAGLYSDYIASFSGENRYNIYPCRGEYFVLDKNASNLISRLVYPVPPKNTGGYGIHLTPTTEGNILIGPSNEYIKELRDVATTKVVMEQLIKEAKTFLPEFNPDLVIRNYSGIRSKIVPPEVGGFTDFVIEKSPKYDNFINLIGIESPGLTSAPGIAKYVVDIIDNMEKLEKDEDYNGKREGITRFNQLTLQEQIELAESNPNYSDIVCRCENITKQEIIDALNNPLGVKTLKGVKYRTRATMGRCQGGYCIARIVEIMKEEFKFNVKNIKLESNSSNLFSGQARGGINYN